MTTSTGKRHTFRDPGHVKAPQVSRGPSKPEDFPVQGRHQGAPVNTRAYRGEIGRQQIRKFGLGKCPAKLQKSRTGHWSAKMHETYWWKWAKFLCTVGTPKRAKIMTSRLNRENV